MRWRYGFYPTTLLETVIVVTVAVFAFETWRGHLALQWRTEFTIPALLFVLAGAISVLVAPSRTAGLGLYRAYIIEPVAFAFVNEPKLRVGALGALVSTFALAVEAEELDWLPTLSEIL